MAIIIMAINVDEFIITRICPENRGTIATLITHRQNGNEIPTLNRLWGIGQLPSENSLKKNDFYKDCNWSVQ